jgi:hypothetical protein
LRINTTQLPGILEHEKRTVRFFGDSTRNLRERSDESLCTIVRVDAYQPAVAIGYEDVATTIEKKR